MLWRSGQAQALKLRAEELIRKLFQKLILAVLLTGVLKPVVSVQRITTGFAMSVTTILT
jgi:hypothetical protein